MSEIELKVTIDEANIILEGLGQMPFARVYGLVSKLQEQAALQLNKDEKTTNAVSTLNKQNVAG